MYCTEGKDDTVGSRDLLGLIDSEGVTPVGSLVGDDVVCFVGFGVGRLRTIKVYGFLVGRGVGANVVCKNK